MHTGVDNISATPDSIVIHFEAELRRLEKERQGIIDEYLEALRLKKIESLKKSIGV